MFDRLRVTACCVAIGLSLLAGCTDSRGAFDDFVGRIPDAAPVPDAPFLSEIPDITGRFLIGLATVVDVDNPFFFLAENTLTANPDGTATLDTTVTPLDYTLFTLVGDPIVFTDVPVSMSGQFVTSATDVVIPGPANPILGAETTISVVAFHPTIRSADLYCGTATGMVTDPLEIDLAGSTMAAIRVPAGAIGTDLPEALSACPPDVGGEDAGVPDAITPDAMVPDATIPDAMNPDATISDAAVNDAS